MTTEIYKDGMQLDEWIEKEVLKRVAAMDVFVTIDGEQIDVDDWSVEDGVVYVKIVEPIVLSDGHRMVHDGYWRVYE